MVWSKVQEFTQAKPGDRWAAIFDFLNGRGDPATNQGGWKCGTGGLTGGDRYLLFTFVDSGGTQRFHQFEFDYSDDSRGFEGCLQLNPDYDSTITDLSQANAFPMRGQYNSSAETWWDPVSPHNNWKLWVSDQDPAAWMISENDVKIGIWPSIKDGTREVPVLTEDLSTESSYLGGDFINYGVMMPSLAAVTDLGQAIGFPSSPIYSTSAIQTPLRGWYYGSFTPHKSTMFKNIPARAAGSYFGTYADDIRQSVVNTTLTMTDTNQISTSYISYGGFKVAYGDDQYWLCLSGNAAESSIVFSTGTQNPSQWLDN